MLLTVLLLNYENFPNIAIWMTRVMNMYRFIFTNLSLEAGAASLLPAVHA